MSLSPKTSRSRFRWLDRLRWRGGGECVPKGPRTQIIGFQGPNTINIIVFGPLGCQMASNRQAIAAFLHGTMRAFTISEAQPSLPPSRFIAL